MEENPLESLRVMSFVSLIAVDFNPAKRDLRSIAATSTSDNSVTYWCGRGGGVGQTCHNLPLPVPCSPAFRTFVSLPLVSRPLFRCSRLITLQMQIQTILKPFFFPISLI